ncbi:MAG: shikimate dehydrogenase [Clostridia bacterium]|nr:shikimate dehydrogenase [Clostridia bacterium]
MLDSRIHASTLRFAVFGESLPHTWSPQIHNSLFAAAGLDAVYLPVTVPKDKIASAVDVFRSCFAGFNVTIPYKERIIPLLDEVDDAVRACGAVNTVENRDGRLIGHITDGLGMLRAIEECKVSTRQANVLILGGGGAARVAGYEFLARGGRVTFAVRDVNKGMKLAAELADTQGDGIARLSVCSLNGIKGAYDLLVNCTPVGMYPHVNERPVDIDVIARCGAVFDAVYNPRTTELLDVAQTLHIPCVEGLGMLFYQAVEAQRIWLGDERIAPEYTQKQIYLDLLANMW